MLYYLLILFILSPFYFYLSFSFISVFCRIAFYVSCYVLTYNTIFLIKISVHAFQFRAERETNRKGKQTGTDYKKKMKNKKEEEKRKNRFYVPGRLFQNLMALSLLTRSSVTG